MSHREDGTEANYIDFSDISNQDPSKRFPRPDNQHSRLAFWVSIRGFLTLMLVLGLVVVIKLNYDLRSARGELTLTKSRLNKLVEKKIRLETDNKELITTNQQLDDTRRRLEEDKKRLEADNGRLEQLLEIRRRGDP